MKRRNISKSIAQRGGLMIEALAMLGLIAVVTPTMYKKSAERTMEVEDINTASTIRTIMNAANDYVGANYSTIIADMGETQKIRKLDLPLIDSYLPYGFKIDKALYNYGKPEIAIAKQGNNLTTFALFKTNTDIGQERTSRIASLIGSSGGYVTGEKKARGIGGIWKLEGDEYSEVFPDGDDAAQYSIVTASADTISAATGNEIDMDKYLQRGRDAGNDPNTLWKNSMRTDLYMGGVDNTYDVYNNENHQKTFSIRNIKSLIVGAENDNIENSTYGLYIADGFGKPDAFIQGNLIAAGEQFKADANRLGFGRNLITEGDTTTEDFHFKVDTNGNATADGSLTNLGDVNLASNVDVWNDVKIGYIDGRADGTYAIKATKEDMNFMGNVMQLKPYYTFENNEANIKDRVVILENGIKSATYPGANLDEITYNNSPLFQVRVGANTKIDGLLATRQLDTQKIRAATLSVGSKNIDDSEKWLTANEDGVTIQNTGDDNITGAEFRENQIMLATGGADANDEAAGLFLLHGNKTADSAAPAVSVLYGGGIRSIMENKTLTIEGAENETRTLFNQGSVDLADANFNIGVGGLYYHDATADRRYVFSVRANSNPNSYAFQDMFTSAGSNQAGYLQPYDIAMHGNVLIGDSKSGQVGRGTESVENGKYHVSIGQYNVRAGVNIVPNSTAGDYSNLVYIDQGATSTTNNYSDTEPGTVYIRKGYMEVRGENSKPATTTGALEGKGVVAASRFVANNLAYGSNGNAVTNKTYGAEFPILATKDFSNYNGSNHDVAYDTYMVNPAYTSVMHDIKLTTRGGARLSDILPDFINKGIYVVNNTVSEETVGNWDFSAKGNSYSEAKGKNEDLPEGAMNLSDKTSWASPFMGVVPAPQCPPGYMRVITLTPASWEMAQAGLIHLSVNKDDSSDYKYYVVPETPNKDQVAAAATPEQRPAFNKVGMVVDKDSTTATTIPVTVGAEKGTADISNVKTSTYVLQADAPYQLTAPLMFQQSTRLKSMVVPLKDGDYVQGWSAIAGFLYSGAKYGAFIKGEAKTDSYYWNVFPVLRGTIEGYATVYCYFNRTNMPDVQDDDDTKPFNGYYGSFIDAYTYMQTMDGLPTDYTKSKSTNTDRLDDPTLKYNEAW